MIYTKSGGGAGPVNSYIVSGYTVSGSGPVVYAARKLVPMPVQASNYPASLAIGQMTGLSIASKSEFILVSNSNYFDNSFTVRLFKRNSDGSNPTWSFVNLFSGGFLQGTSSNAISSNGQYGIYLAKFSLSAVFHNNNLTTSEITNVGTRALPNEDGAAAFNSDGEYLALMYASSPFLEIKKRSGSGASATFSDLTLASRPSTGGKGGLAFSPNSTYLAVAPLGAPQVYKFNSGTGTFDNLSSPFSGTTPTSAGGAAWSQDGNVLAIRGDNQTFIYERSSDTFTYKATIPFGGVGGFDPTGNYYITTGGRIYRKDSITSWSLYKRIEAPTPNGATAGEFFFFSSALT